jgi:hypothetical protein
VLAEQAKVAKRNAELREAQLQDEVVKPAQAEAERVRIAAEGTGRGHPAGRSGIGPHRARPGRDQPAA